MTTSTASTLCGITLATLLSTTAGTAQADPRINIDLDNVDYAAPAQVDALYARIKLAARMVCVDSSSPWDARRMAYIDSCRNAAVADAVGRIDQPQLTALHYEGKDEERVGLASE